jgi:hypothetical protein
LFLRLIVFKMEQVLWELCLSKRTASHFRTRIRMYLIQLIVVIKLNQSIQIHYARVSSASKCPRLTNPRSVHFKSCFSLSWLAKFSIQRNKRKFCGLCVVYNKLWTINTFYSQRFRKCTPDRQPYILVS